MEQKLLRLRKRPEFLAVQKGEKRRGALFLLEVKPRSEASGERNADKSGAPASLFAGRRKRQLSKAEAESLPRLGLTVTRKNGNAVRRNRIKRRLRAACRLSGLAVQAATDYVLVARPDILTVPFARLGEELRRRFNGQNGVKAGAAKSRAKKQAKHCERKERSGV